MVVSWPITSNANHALMVMFLLTTNAQKSFQGVTNTIKKDCAWNAGVIFN